MNRVYVHESNVYVLYFNIRFNIHLNEELTHACLSGQPHIAEHSFMHTEKYEWTILCQMNRSNERWMNNVVNSESFRRCHHSDEWCMLQKWHKWLQITHASVGKGRFWHRDCAARFRPFLFELRSFLTRYWPFIFFCVCLFFTYTKSNVSTHLVFIVYFGSLPPIFDLKWSCLFSSHTTEWHKWIIEITITWMSFTWSFCRPFQTARRNHQKKNFPL